MILCNERMRVALTTTHLPVAQVPAAITRQSVLSKIESLARSLRHDFAIILGQAISYYIYLWNLNIKGVWQRVPGLLRVIIVVAPPVLLALTAGSASEAFDAFFRRADLPMWLLVFGSAGNLILSLRFIYQWLYSRRAGESELPAGFWIFSLAGAAIVFVYGILRADIVLMLGQGFGLIVYSRNLIIGHRAAAGSK